MRTMHRSLFLALVCVAAPLQRAAAQGSVAISAQGGNSQYNPASGDFTVRGSVTIVNDAAAEYTSSAQPRFVLTQDAGPAPATPNPGSVSDFAACPGAVTVAPGASLTCPFETTISVEQSNSLSAVYGTAEGATSSEAVLVSYPPAPAPEPSPIPSPEPSPIPSPEPSPEPAPVPSPEPSPVPSPEPSPVPSPEPSPVSSPIPSPEASPAASPVPSPTPSPSPEASPSASSRFSQLPSPSPSPSPLPLPAIPPNVTIKGLNPTNGASYTWEASSVVTPTTDTVRYDQKTTAKYVVTATRKQVGSSAFSISGSIVLENKNDGPVKISQVRVEIPRGVNSPIFIDATCPEDTIPGSILGGLFPGKLTCTFSGALPDDSPGTIQAQIKYGMDKDTSSAIEDFNFDNAKGGKVGECADVTDYFFGFAPTSVDGAKAPSDGTVRICDSKTWTYTATFGPYKNGVCTKDAQKTTETVVVNPVASSQDTVSDSTVHSLTITGCSKQAPALAVFDIKTRAIQTTLWGVQKYASKPAVSMPYNGAATVTYKVEYSNSYYESDYEASVKIFVGNFNSGDLALQNVQLEINFGSYQATVNAYCPGQDRQGRFVLQPNDQVVCTAVYSSPSNGYLETVYATAQVANTVYFSAGAVVSYYNPQLFYRGQCAFISDNFYLNSLDTLIAPTSIIDGFKPPNDDKPVQVCGPVTYVYTAKFSGFSSKCGNYEAYNIASVQNPGIQETATSYATVSFDVTGCAPPAQPMPVVTLGNLTTLNITGNYTWAISRTPATAPATSLAFSAKKSLPLKTTFTRSAKPVNVTAYAIQGSVNLISVTASPVTTTQVLLLVAIGPNQEPMTYDIRAGCDQTTDSVVIPAAGGKGVDCVFAVPNPDGNATVAAVWVEVQEGRNVTSNIQAIDFYKAPNVIAGQCADVAETYVFTGPAKPTVTDAWSAKIICKTTTYDYAVNFGPYSNAQCGSYKLTATATLEPTTGFGSVLSNTLTAPVAVTGCAGRRRFE